MSNNDVKRAASSRSTIRRTPRIRTACIRCQQRKIRCDALSPCCSPCSKSGASCVYSDRNPHQNHTQFEFAWLQRRVKWLEWIVQQNCPDIDLNQQPAEVQLDTDIEGLSYAVRNDRGAQHSSESGRAVIPRGSVGSHTQEQQQSNERITEDSLTHEVGLVSLSADAEPKYVGPSSGFVFARLLTSIAKRPDDVSNNGSRSHQSSKYNDQEFLSEFVHNCPADLPATETGAQQLVGIYFETVHFQYPFLHEPSLRRLITQIYQPQHSNKLESFQVKMVLSISAVILSRRTKFELPADGWCSAAVSDLSQTQVESSTTGLQALLLLSIYALHSPSSKINPWYINYQCLAMVLDLGLQRDSRNARFSVFQSHMRARIFWVVYTLDRRLSTMMGRPIGLRDEGCDLRLPANISDDDLDTAEIDLHSGPFPVSHMTYSVHFFRLSMLNSEIKYVLHSIRRTPPSYAYPAVRDINQWQDEMCSRLEQWADEIPCGNEHLEYASTLSQIQCCTTTMLLMVPSPGIPNPRLSSLHKCYESSLKAIRLFDGMYRQDRLVYSWDTCHSLILHSVCGLYCLIVLGDLSVEERIDILTGDLRAALNLLSAAGEYWIGAKRSRGYLDELSGRILQKLLTMKHSDTVLPIPLHHAGIWTEQNYQARIPDDSQQFQTPADSSPGLSSDIMQNSNSWSEDSLQPLDLFQSVLEDTGTNFQNDDLFPSTFDFSALFNDFVQL